MVVEVDHCISSVAALQKLPRRCRTIHCQPLILILALWELHDLSQTTSSKRRLSILSQLVARVALVGISGSELVSRALVTKKGS